jgi:HEAT repeat protein
MKPNQFLRLNGLRKLEEPELIQALLNDEDDIVRHEAAFILSDLKSAGKIKNVPEAISALLNAAKDPSQLVRHEVALALADFVNEQTIKALLELNRDKSGEVSRSAEFAFVKIFNDKVW